MRLCHLQRRTWLDMFGEARSLLSHNGFKSLKVRQRSFPSGSKSLSIHADYSSECELTFQFNAHNISVCYFTEMRDADKQEQQVRWAVEILWESYQHLANPAPFMHALQRSLSRIITLKSLSAERRLLSRVLYHPNIGAIYNG